MENFSSNSENLPGIPLPSDGLVLVVDDEQEIREMTRSMLQKRGLRVALAADGVQALKCITDETPAIILLDVLMPNMDGYTFYKQLKNNPDTNAIPVLVVTGRGQMEDSFTVLGVDGFVTKPFTPDQLVREISLILEMDRARQQMGRSQTAGKKILVIGNQQKVLDDMTAKAVKTGCEIKTVRRGGDAIAQTVKFIPDIIFIDIQLEDITTAEAMAILKRLPQLEGKPIIGYSYYETDQLAQTEVRRKIMNIEEASQRFLAAKGTAYMGRYNHSVFIHTLTEYLKSS